MKKLILAAAVAGAVLLSSAAQAQTTPEGYQLQQVLMMSRHNLRAPLANNGSVLEQSTPNQWPEWDVPGGQLTTKGGVLEIYMGHYMREWLAELGMVTSGECPTPDTVYTYANSLQRTVATAQFFITGAFPGCDIPVHHQEKMGTMDPTFNPVITDDSAAFSQKAVQAMEKERSQMQLDDSYQLLAQMTDYKDSPSCKEKQQCSLTEAKDAFREGANKQVISSQADSLIKISRIWADFFPANNRISLFRLFFPPFLALFPVFTEISPTDVSFGPPETGWPG